MSNIARIMQMAGSVPNAAGDPYFDDVSLLLHGDGTDGSTTFTDSSNNNFTVTANGNAQIDTTVVKYGTGSMQFDGTGDYLEIANNAAFQFGTDDFTMEAWVYISGNSAQNTFNSNNRNATIVSGLQTGSVNNDFWWVIKGNPSTTGTGIWFRVWNSGSGEDAINVDFTITQNIWHHFAVTRSGTTVRLFFNGVVQQTTTGFTSNVTSGSNPLKIARSQNTGYIQDLNGYIDDLRITKGVARYTADFTPPTQAFPDK